MARFVLLPFLLASIGITVSAIAANIDPNELNDNSHLEKVQDGEASIEPRNDLDDVDFSSFFDFDSDDDNDGFTRENSAIERKPGRTPKPLTHRHRYWFPPNYHSKQSNHKSSVEKSKDIGDSPAESDGGQIQEDQANSPSDQTFNDDREDSKTANASTNLPNQYVVGNYQVSIVDSNSPLLSSLGLRSDQLKSWAAASNRRSGTFPIYASPYKTSESVRSQTYVEYPRPQPPTYGPHPQSPPPEPYAYEKPKHQASIGEHYKGSGEAVVYGNPPPHRGPEKHPQPSSTDYAPHHQHYQHHPPPQYSHPSQQPPSTAPQHQPYSPYRGNSPSSAPHYPPNNPDHRDTAHQSQEHKRVLGPDDPNYNRGAWQQPKQLYPPHPAPLPAKPASETPHHDHYAPSSTLPKTNNSPYSASYAQPKPSYGSASLSPSSYYSSQSSPSSHSYHPPATNGGSKAPSRAGSLGYSGSPTYHEHSHSPPSKPMITVRFKARAPDGSHGLNIPLNFNPLEVVKKLAAPLSALNPLANKKVTIGITIENKDKHDYGHEEHPY